ncbi:MAG TPA: CorA family divalent cation transporter, partial [Candidatus Krumholzibacterium sp.]|nr:CorA family divalent cation transporter [Candidatus Krumholzibacterium sp.]
MSRLFRKSTKPAGLPPGTLVFNGRQKVEKTRLTLFDYDENEVREKVIDRIEDSFPFKDTPTVTWINIDGLHDTEIVRTVGEHFDIHPLVLEDILSTGQRPKLQESDDYLFITLNMLSYDEEKNEVLSEQVSLILGHNYVISFQERPGDVFEPVRDRLRGKKGKIARMGADYLCYALLDTVVDNYFSIL